jgi:Protein of unknown function (DUF4238)
MSDENQHWVPKFLIRNFADSDGRVFCLDIHADRVVKRPPKYVAAEPAFNNFIRDGEPISFEDKLESIETRAAPILRRIISAQSLANIGSEERQRVAEFIAAQSFRTKAFYEGLADKPDRQEFGGIFAKLSESMFITANWIVRRGWVLTVIEDDEVFYIGDNPVVLQRTDNPKDGRNLGLDVTGVEAFMPLSPQHALYMRCSTTSNDRIARYDTAVELHRIVRSSALRGLPGGSGELQTAQLVIRTLHPLVTALRTGAPLTVDRSNIENLNYLQCSWSHTAIYSNRNDFAFARRVFRENPHYKSAPKTSLIQKNALVPESLAKS